MRGHIVHLALVAGIQPALQVGLVLTQLQAADAHLLEAQFTAPVLDGLSEAGEVEGGVGHAGRESAVGGV